MVQGVYKILKSCKTRVLTLADNIHDDFMSLGNSNYDKEHIKQYLDGVNLSTEEKKIIKDKYGSVIPHIRRGYEYFRALKCIDKFDERYVPSGYYYPYIIRALNPDRFKSLLAHKSLLQLMYSAEVLQPHTPIRSIAGVYFDADNKRITPNQAAEIISETSTPLLFKPSTDSSYGNGIMLYQPDDMKRLASEIRQKSLLRKTYTDFVLQVPVGQSAETRKFNPTSLNCMRITTLNLNGRITTHSMTLKCGPVGSFVDNIGSGKRGVIVGIKQDGCLAPYGFYGNGEKCFEHNGIKFEGQRIHSIKKVVEAAFKLHSMVDLCHVIGWDIALDENNRAILIEGNTTNPGISLEQMCSGPVFGDRIDEILQFCNSKYSRMT